MFFSSWRFCSRRLAPLSDLTAEVDRDPGTTGDDHGIQELLRKHDSADVDKLSATEEDADESIEDCMDQQQIQLTPSTTTTATSAPRDTSNAVLQPAENRDKSQLVQVDGSIASGASLEQMKVIPFVSLHLDAKTPSSKATSSGSTSEDDGSFFWKTTLAKALVEEASHQPTERGESLSSQPRGGTDIPETPSIADASPSTCSSIRLRTVPLRSIIPATTKGAAAIHSRNRTKNNRHLWPTIPSTISVQHACEYRVTDESNGGADCAMLWDPAKPLLFGDPAKHPAEWAANALDLNSPFAESCRQILSLLTANRRDDRILHHMARSPELCLVRFRVDDAIQQLMHWCCRQMWLEGVDQCYRSIPEVIGYSVDSMLPLHTSVVAAGASAATTTGNDGSVKLVEFLCQRFPPALKQTNSRLQTPLHLALSASRIDEPIVSCLLTWYPTAALLADEGGWTPTHYVCRHQGDSATRALRLLLEHTPAAIDAVTRNLEKPIHIAAQKNAGELIGVFMEVAEAHADASQVDICMHEAECSTHCEKTSVLRNDGAIPASDEPRALCRPPPSPAIPSLLASCLDFKANTPIHYLAMHGNRADQEAMRTLIDSWPHGKTIRNADGSTPFELAVESGASEDVLNLLR
jgi:ankyrin repeat protein